MVRMTLDVGRLEAVSLVLGLGGFHPIAAGRSEALAFMCTTL
jgi:hypothetical protein